MLICLPPRYFQLIKAHCDTALINKPAAVRQLNGDLHEISRTVMKYHVNYQTNHHITQFVCSAVYNMCFVLQGA